MDVLKRYRPFILAILVIALVAFFVFRNVNRSKTSTTVPSRINTVQTPNPSAPSVVVASGNALPTFNMQTYKCSNFNYNPDPSTSNPSFNPQKFTWQTSAPRVAAEMPKVNTVAQLGLRNKFGKVDESFEFVVKVFQPDGTTNVGRGVLKADQWAMQNFPKDFQSGTTSKPGIYTFTYEIAGVPIACDGFEVVQ